MRYQSYLVSKNVSNHTIVVNMRLNILLLLAGSFVLTLGACRSSSPSKTLSDGADWTMHGRTYDEQRFAEPYLKAAELDELISLARKGRARRRAERVGTSRVWSNVT